MALLIRNPIESSKKYPFENSQIEHEILRKPFLRQKLEYWEVKVQSSPSLFVLCLYRFSRDRMTQLTFIGIFDVFYLENLRPLLLRTCVIVWELPMVS